MSDLLGTGANSLLAFQRALTTTSHNIANLNTEGYSRQRVNLQALPPTYHRNGYVGNGVRVTGVERLSEQFATSRIMQTTSSHSQQETHLKLSSRIDSLVSDQSLSLTPAINSFFNSLQDVNANPTSLASREVLLTHSDNIASRFRSMQLQLDSTQTEVNQNMSAAVSEINELASGIAELNDRIGSNGYNLFGTEPNDLLDQRDLLLTRLSEQVDINTLEQDDGAVNVFMGNGVALVVGLQSRTLRTSINPIDSDRLQVELSQGTDWLDISGRLHGGAIGGLMEFESQTLTPAMNRLGQLALNLSNMLNEQHALGIDLNGDQGNDLFTLNEPVAVSSEKNTGTASINAVFSNVDLVQASEYSVRYTGSDYVITRRSDGEETASALPLTLDGMDISIIGSANAGDTFRISPTRRSAAAIESLVRDPKQIALSSPLRSMSQISNLSDASIGQVNITDINDPGFQAPIDIIFVSESAFNIVDATSGTVLSSNVAYSATTPVQFNGWSANITGSPSSGDIFNVVPNNTAQGNNANGLAIANIQSATTADGTSTLNDNYSSMVSRIGAQTRSLQTRTEALNNVRLDSIERMQAVSGVNLDEEAINLTRYEQAYQASAQIIATADTLFQTLLGVVAR